MKLSTTFEELIEANLADPRKVDVVTCVDRLLTVASENGAVRCTWDSEQGMQFSVRDPLRGGIGARDNHGELDVVYTLESPVARSLLRMLCARLGVLCRESTGREISFYGDRAVIERGEDPPGRWCISFTNTPERQEFLIERL